MTHRMNKLAVAVPGVASLALLAVPIAANAQNLYVGQNTTQITRITLGDSESTFATGLNDVSSLAFDSSGNLFAANRSGSSIYKITADGTVSTFVSSDLANPLGLTFDKSGNLYVGNYGGGYISKITPTGVVSTYASGGGLFGPGGMTFDNAGNLYVANVGDGTIREVAPNGQVSLFASGLMQPNSIVFNGASFYATSAGANAIVKISMSGVVTTFSSGGSLAFPEGLAMGNDGNLYSGNRNANHLSKITSDGTATDFAPGVFSTSVAFGPNVSAPEPTSLLLVFGGLSSTLCSLSWKRRKGMYSA